jgi:hypothetical protein
MSRSELWIVRISMRMVDEGVVGVGMLVHWYLRKRFQCY